MVFLLAQTLLHILKEIPSNLWSKAIESPYSVEYVIDIIGYIKTFNKNKVFLPYLFQHKEKKKKKKKKKK